MHTAEWKRASIFKWKHQMSGRNGSPVLKSNVRNLMQACTGVITGKGCEPGFLKSQADFRFLHNNIVEKRYSNTGQDHFSIGKGSNWTTSNDMISLCWFRIWNYNFLSCHVFKSRHSFFLNITIWRLGFGENKSTLRSLEMGKGWGPFHALIAVGKTKLVWTCS